ncbi:hypothetical protein ACE6H2_003103 [Prunus campanulata]
MLENLGTIHTGELALVHYFLGYSPGYDDSLPKLHLYNMKSKRFRILDFIFPDSVMRYDGDECIRLIASYGDSIVPLK